jgi:hypothetical protein
MVGGDPDVRRAAVDHAEHRPDHASDGANFAAAGIARRRQGVVVAEQLVGAVDEMNLQCSPPRSQYPGADRDVDRRFRPLYHRAARRADVARLVHALPPGDCSYEPK